MEYDAGSATAEHRSDADRIHSIIENRINPDCIFFDPVVDRIRKAMRQHPIEPVAYGMDSGVDLERFHFGIERIREIRTKTLLLPLIEGETSCEVVMSVGGDLNARGRTPQGGASILPSK